MYLLLSPAKTLDFSPTDYSHFSEADFLTQSAELIEILRDYGPEDIAHLMKISDKLSALNHQRFSDWQPPKELEPGKQALLAFRGDVYKGLQADDFGEEELAFAQKHLGILSGLYGLLRPLDLILPYRLEMKTKLPNSKGQNLYDFWGEQLTKAINERANGPIINLASKEYFSALQPKAFKQPLYQIDFKEVNAEGKARIIAVHAKKARGLMARYVIQKQLEKVEDLKGFAEENYAFDEERSSDFHWVFSR
ncbi:peroxide stress protein YaaA [Saprospira sp. CCB-QB6]|uniref:peroxide stress protein YaaA n=1 Tax=Saprospira sp. CCB-QB6 TaxID=3023936 RepID=UPI002349580D|nr:peroxide stress protein YaaA [Saprospira sp. CCB-QB6]WCL81094.1 peroxide stress protein YaaA [Saprospira sp. CCB-QB6]